MDAIEQEIEALEREAADPANSGETRYANQLKAILLRSGYRLQTLPEDNRIIAIVHVPSQVVVEQVTVNALRHARMGARGWIQALEAKRQAQG